MNKEKIDYKREYFDSWLLDFGKRQNLGVSTLPPKDCDCPHCMKRKSESSNRL